MKYKVAVLGAGHWGMALASVLAENDIDVMVWARDVNEVNRINMTHCSKYFSEKYIFDEKIVAYNDLDFCISEAQYIVISTPVHTIESLLPYIRKYNKKYLLTCKGLYNGDIVTNCLYNERTDCKVAVLSGPSFSSEIIDKKITAVVIASKEESIAKEFQSLFHNASYFRPYTSTDEIGVQLCGAVKNVYAIAAGMVDRIGESSNMKSALLTRALAEMRRLISVCGGNSETLLGLAGIGDLMLTCHSANSRNYCFGYNYAGNIKTTVTTEGILASKEFYVLAKKNGVDMPIVTSLYNILYENMGFDEVVDLLLERSLKDEITY